MVFLMCQITKSIKDLYRETRFNDPYVLQTTLYKINMLICAALMTFSICTEANRSVPPLVGQLVTITQGNHISYYSHKTLSWMVWTKRNTVEHLLTDPPRCGLSLRNGHFLKHRLKIPLIQKQTNKKKSYCKLWCPRKGVHSSLTLCIDNNAAIQYCVYDTAKYSFLHFTIYFISKIQKTHKTHEFIKNWLFLKKG